MPIAGVRAHKVSGLGENLGFHSPGTEDAEVALKCSWDTLERDMGPSFMTQWLMKSSRQWVCAGISTAPPGTCGGGVCVGALSSETWLCTGSASRLKQLVVCSPPPNKILRKYYRLLGRFLIKNCEGLNACFIRGLTLLG